MPAQPVQPRDPIDVREIARRIATGPASPPRLLPTPSPAEGVTQGQFQALLTLLRLPGELLGLINALAAAPGDADTLDVLADWLDEAGRREHAARMRALAAKARQRRAKEKAG